MWGTNADQPEYLRVNIGQLRKKIERSEDPAYIVTEDMIEYHWLSDPTPRVFQLGVPGSLASQYVVVKFGGVVVKGANYAHYQVLVDR